MERLKKENEALRTSSLQIYSVVKGSMAIATPNFGGDFCLRGSMSPTKMFMGVVKSHQSFPGGINKVIKGDFCEVENGQFNFCCFFFLKLNLALIDGTSPDRRLNLSY